MKAIREQRKIEKCKKFLELERENEEELDEIISVTTTTINNEENTDSELSEADSYCRHCLRPQSELRFKYMRPKQRSKIRQQRQEKREKREKSKQRYSSYGGEGTGSNNIQQKTRSKKRSKSRAKRARNSKHFSSSHNKEQQYKLPLMRDINEANEQAIRFRCPQVGPQVGRNRQMPPQLHFHHPQHVQQQLTAYQVQYTHTYGQQIQHQQHQHHHHHHSCKRFANQSVSPIQTTLTMESELKHTHYHHHNNHHHQQHHNEHLTNNQKSNQSQNQQHRSTPTKDSLTATTINLQNCCTSYHQPQPHQYHPHQHSQNQSPNRASHYNQPVSCSCCCCYIPATTSSAIVTTTISGTTTNTTSITTTTTTQHYQHQHHNLPQLPSATHTGTASIAVATLDATTSATAAASTAAVANTQPSLTTDNSTNLQNNSAAAAEEDPSNPATATTPDSPSLVKVSTWYTVAKQGVSC